MIVAMMFFAFCDGELDAKGKRGEGEREGGEVRLKNIFVLSPAPFRGLENEKNPNTHTHTHKKNSQFPLLQ